MKLAISGKGGVGKTTLSAMLAGTLALTDRKVVVVDADPDANLASALGVHPDEPVTPLADMHDLIRRRTGAGEGYGTYFKLNPRVDDIPEAYARRIGNIRLLVLGGIRAGGDGCLCPATALLKALLVHLILGRDDALIMDMEAGIEHLGRATAQSMDALIVVVDPSPWSHQTADLVRKLAADIGVRNVFAVANRTDDPARLEEIQRRLGEVPLIGHLPFDERLVEGIVAAGPDGGMRVLPALQDHLQALRGILAQVQERT